MMLVHDRSDFCFQLLDEFFFVLTNISDRHSMCLAAGKKMNVAPKTLKSEAALLQ
jgi:hypothetical protein